MSSFKVPCPSCEAPVLIKDLKLVGTKVECPKCKYRFKVEEPAVAPVDPKKPDAKAAPADAKAGAKAAKPEKKAAATATPSKKKKLVPMLVGGGAVVLLVVIGVFAFGGKGKPKGGPKGSGPGPGGVVQQPGPGPDGVTPPDPKGSNDPKNPPPPATAYSVKNTSNLLPGSTVAVYRFNMDKVRETPAYSALADRQVSALFVASMGFAPEDVETYIQSYAGPARDTFGVIKLKNPSKPADVTAKMALEPKPKAVKKWELHTVRSNLFATAFSQAMAMRALFGDYFTALPPAPAARPMGVCVYDTQHVFIGDLALVEQFLNSLDANGDPPFETVLSSEAGGTTPTAPVPGAPPVVPGPAPKPLVPGAPVVPPKNPVPPAPKPPAPGEKGFTSVDAYRSLKFPLKKALDDMEAGLRTPPAMVYAEEFDPKQYDVQALKREYALLSGALDPMVKRNPRYLSANVIAFSERRLVANLRVTFGSPDDAQAVIKDQVAPGLALFTEMLTLYLSTSKADRVEFRDYTVAGTAPGTGTGNPPGMGLPPGMGFPPGMGGPPPMPGTGTGSPGSAPPLPGGGPPPMPGGGPPPMPGGGPPPMPGGMLPGGGPPPMPGGGPPIGPGPGPGPTDPKQSDTPASHIDLGIIDKQVVIAVDLNWSEDVYRTTVMPRVSGVTNKIKGTMAIFSSEFSWHAVAAAGPKAAETKKAFPRGTYDRPKTDPNRLGLEYPPVQRVSLFYELLPYLGRGNLAARVKPNYSWYAFERDTPDPRTPDKPGAIIVDNLSPGGEWVPELLVPYYPQNAWRATSPFAPDHTFGATNYVAVAGRGLGIARAPVDKNGQVLPAFADKVGMTGYGWGSKPDEVKDGLSNTIYMLQTPPGLQQPWIAGGGATVRGLDEDDPMAAFKYDHPDGKGGKKSGTYALMGDGSVRWIPANIDKDVLLALSTRAGGTSEKVGDLNALAPKIEAPKPPEPPKPKVEEKKPEDKKPEEKKPEDKKPDPKAIDPKAVDPKKPEDKKEPTKLEPAPPPKAK